MQPSICPRCCDHYRSDVGRRQYTGRPCGSYDGTAFVCGCFDLCCGASGVPGGSLLLIPLACGLFGIDQNVAMQVVAVGFVIGVLQDSAETALNSSTDVLFTAAACEYNDRKSRAG